MFKHSNEFVTVFVSLGDFYLLIMQNSSKNIMSSQARCIYVDVQM